MSQSKTSSATSSNISAADKPKRRYRTADQLWEIIDAFHRSDLTRAEFCRQYGIAVSGLYHWQRKFKQQSTPARTAEEAFVEIQAPGLTSHVSTQPWDVELELGQGRVLRVRIA